MASAAALESVKKKARLAAKSEKPVFIVAGTTSHGKSTLIEKLLKLGETPPGVSDSLAGTTKLPELYNCIADGKEFTIVDLPGIGDDDVSVSTIMAFLDTFLSVCKFQGILVINKVNENPGVALKLIGPAMREGVKDGWENVFFIGSHKDKADESRKQVWSSSASGAFAKLFGHAPGKMLMTSKDDAASIASLRTEIARSIDGKVKVQYDSVPSDKLAEIAGSALGMDLTKDKRKVQQLEEDIGTMKEKHRREIEVLRRRLTPRRLRSGCRVAFIIMNEDHDMIGDIMYEDHPDYEAHYEAFEAHGPEGPYYGVVTYNYHSPGYHLFRGLYRD